MVRYECGRYAVGLPIHDLRHDFCSKLVQRGVDLYSVAGLAGHKDIKTTQRYAHLSPEKLKSAISVLNSGHVLVTLEKSSKMTRLESTRK